MSLVKFAPLVLTNVLRKTVRTLFTILSIVIAFLLFGLLSAIRVAFGMGVELAGVDRLVTIHKVSLIQPLPASYEARIEAIPGVVDVAHASWFGGIYQEPSNFFAQMPVVPEEWLRMYPEFIVPEDQKSAWFADRTGALVGRTIAERFGWKIGDRIPLQGTIWRKSGGNDVWEFTIRGIYDGAEKGTDTAQFLFHYDYFDEARAFGRGLVGWYVIRIADPQQAPRIAARVDQAFANSPAETKTATEKAFVQSFASQVGNIGAIVTAILTAVFFTIVLVAGNTMAQAIRERTSELAVLKTLGCSNATILGLVLGESLLLAAVGGGAGLALAWMATSAGDPTGGFLPAFYLPVHDVWVGIGLIIGLGLATGAAPAAQAMRLRIVDALRRG